MPDAVVDTTVLYAAGNERSQRHDRGLATLQAADHDRLPRLRIPDVVLVETMNGLTRDVGHATAVDMLDRLEASTGFVLDRTTNAVWHAGVDTFRGVERLSLADGLIAAYARHHDIDYVYSFDGGFDGVDGIARLADATNPYAQD